MSVYTYLSFGCAFLSIALSLWSMWLSRRARRLSDPPKWYYEE